VQVRLRGVCVPGYASAVLTSRQTKPLGLFRLLCLHQGSYAAIVDGDGSMFLVATDLDAPRIRPGTFIAAISKVLSGITVED
jgi:hypothetical protein